MELRLVEQVQSHLNDVSIFHDFDPKDTEKVIVNVLNYIGRFLRFGRNDHLVMVIDIKYSSSRAQSRDLPTVFKSITIDSIKIKI